MDNIWKLESEEQDAAADNLNIIIETALEGKATFGSPTRACQDYLKTLWSDTWQTIKERLNIEGSCWYVWYMDGVNQHLQNLAQ